VRFCSRIGSPSHTCSICPTYCPHILRQGSSPSSARASTVCSSEQHNIERWHRDGRGLWVIAHSEVYRMDRCGSIDRAALWARRAERNSIWRILGKQVLSWGAMTRRNNRWHWQLLILGQEENWETAEHISTQRTRSEKRHKYLLIGQEEHWEIAEYISTQRIQMEVWEET
jgi:hypothetical protein